MQDQVMQFFAFGSVLMDLWIIDLLVALWIVYKFKSKSKLSRITKKYLVLVAGYWMEIMFVLVLSATFGSLLYSEVFGLAPCKLCWYQRIFMYPQIPILGFAMLKKDKNIGEYLFLLSVIGLIIAVYQYVLQLGVVNDFAGCSILPGAVDCADNYGVYFGYVTIPKMSVSVFGLMSIFSVLGMNRKLAKRGR